MSWRFGVVGLVCLLATVAFASSADDAGPDSAGFRSHAFSGPDGTDATLGDFEGQPLVVNFFASWCPPCRAELPDLEAFHQAGDGQVQLIGISHDLARSSWLSLVTEAGLTFPTYHQPDQEIFTELDLFAMPTTIFVSAEGEIAHTHGGVLTERSLRDSVAEHLGVTIPEMGAT
ncbi:MAG: TlpA disulfide reductase family protein [Actinomycetota bacterium]